MERAVGDYVIVRELLHFSVPHHGRLLEKFDAGASGRL
jgi:hypothetical protein